MESGGSQTALLVLSLGLAVLLLAAFVLMVLLVRLRKASPRRKGAQVDFVVDTFHELVASLKEKERELEVLKMRAEERAGRMEEDNENILQSVPSGVMSMDAGGRIVKVNAAAETILGLKGDALVGRPGSEVLPEEFLEGERSRGEGPYRAPEGGDRWLGYSLTPLRDAEGAEIGRLLVFTDLTELRNLAAQAELRTRLASLGEMAAGIAHELRNPMGVIAGYAGLLGRSVDDALRPTVEAVEREVAVMDRIIGDFLSFARPGKLTRRTIDAGQVVRESVESMREGLGEVNVEVVADSPAVLEADEVLLRQAVVNLVQNAAQALGESQGTVRVACRQKEGEVEIEVADPGPGVPEGVRDKVFLPFYTTKEQGTGLGLAIVHRIVTEHGGNIMLETGQEGSTFRIRLPRGSR